MADYSDLSKLKVEIDDHLATVTLNVPETGNAINGDFADQLTEVFYRLNGDLDVYAIVITGAGDAFSAGGDPNYIKEIGPPDYDEVFLAVRRLITNILHLDKPLIAALNGDTIGVGATIAVNADLIVAGEGIDIADTHVKGGLVAGDGGALMWALNAGFPLARYHLLTGEPIKAERACEVGLINEVVPRDQVLARGTELGRRMADGPGQAIRGTKRAFAKITELLGAGFFEFAGELERISLYSEDHKEALAAGEEGRAPEFKHR